MNIAFFISDHGLGHLMRNIPVIRCLVSSGHKAVLICSENHINIAKTYLQDLNISYFTCNTDVGLFVVPGTLKIDKIKTAAAVSSFINQFPDYIKLALKLFTEYHIDRVVVDIVPWALLASKQYGIKSYFMANFTWIEQYKDFISSSSIKVLEDAFKSADVVLYYELANDQVKKLLGDGIDIGFVARPFNQRCVQEIRKGHTNPIVYISIGASNSGLENKINVEHLPYDFICTEKLNFVGRNVTVIPKSTPNTQDFVKAADYCIAKAGWGTVAEIMLAQKRFALLKRPDVYEDTYTINEIERLNAGIGINVSDLSNMSSILMQLQNYNLHKRQYTNNIFYISSIISSS